MLIEHAGSATHIFKLLPSQPRSRCREKREIAISEARQNNGKCEREMQPSSLEMIIESGRIRGIPQGLKPDLWRGREMPRLKPWPT